VVLNVKSCQIVNKAWNFAHVLRDDGLSHMVMWPLKIQEKAWGQKAWLGLSDLQDARRLEAFVSSKNRNQ